VRGVRRQLITAHARRRRRTSTALSSAAVSAADSIAEVQRSLAPLVRDGTLPGYVAAVSVDGERQFGCDGRLALPEAAKRGEPPPADLEVDAIFRLASLSKLVAAALTLSIVADGIVALEEPVTTWLPELASPRVLMRIDGPLTDTVPATRPILVSDLLTMTCGFGLVTTRGPLFDALKQHGLMPGPFAPPFSGDEFMRRLAALPLAIQPGSGWLYHTGIDALSVLLARAAGRPVSELLQERITGPLQMSDTAFFTDQLHRFTTAYRPTPAGLEVLDLPRGRFSQPPRFEAFASGLVSTAPDFLSFLECLLDDGGTVLDADAVTLMRTDRLDDRQRASARFLGEGRSWGLGGEVVLRREHTAVAAGGFGWMGGTGTSGYIDPQRRLAAVLMSQRAMETSRPPEFFVRFWDAVYRGL
jgi:CubicO group peptidase (beta-lactamase class C family)